MVDLTTESIGKWISLLYRYSQTYLNEELEQFNLGSGQYIFLLHLYGKDGINQAELSSRICIDKSTTARAIDHLVKEEYVVRKEDPEDKRAYRIYITEKALQIKPSLHEILERWNNIIADGLSMEERRCLLNSLQKMSDNVLSYYKTYEE